MIKKIILAASFCSLALAGSLIAQPVSVGSSQNYNPATPKFNYMMGVVDLNTTKPISTPTTTIPVNPVSVGSTTCPAYLTTYHKLGDSGPDVVKLQKFLNKYHGANLNEKGFFGSITMQEVKNLQFNYSIKTTGNQHEKTTKLINDIVCGKVVSKARVVYVEARALTATNYLKVPQSTLKPIANTLPLGGTITKPVNTTVKKDVVNNNLVPKPVSTTTSSYGKATTSGFVENLKTDFQKIKENYKAYLLVFALVLALFWFLRKAATE